MIDYRKMIDGLLLTLMLITTASTVAAKDIDSTLTPRLDPVDTVATPSPWSFGGELALSINRHSASFEKLPGVPSCCPAYSGSTGLGPGLDLQVRRTLDLRFDVGLGLGVAMIGTRLATDEQKTIFDGTGPATATLEHSIDAQLIGLTIEPFAAVRPIEQIEIFLGPSLRLLPIATAEQQERIVAPEGVRYENGRLTRLEWSGTIPERRGLSFGAIGGIGALLPLEIAEGLRPTLRVSYRLHPTSIISTEEWSVSTVSVGIGLRYRGIDRETTSDIDPFEPIEATETPSGS